MIVGITGTICSGKRELAGFLEKEGFEYKSLNDYLVDDSFIGKKYLPEDIFKLRSEAGIDLVERFKKDIDDENYIINNIESESEIKALQNLDNFYLFFIGGDIRRRYHKWANKMKDQKRTFEELARFNRSGWMNYWTFYQNPFDKQIRKLKPLADFTLKNFEGGNSIEKQFDKVYKELQQRI